MKNAFRCLVIASVIALISSTEEPVAPSSEAREYLNRQLREAKIEVAKSYSQDPPEALDRPYPVRRNRLWSESLDSDTALAVSLWNETFVLANDRVLRVEVEVSDSVMLHQVALINQPKPVKFVRSTMNKGSLFLLMCQEDGSCNLHVGPNADELRHRQVIKHRGLPMDAKFFSQINQLYLVVADNSGQFSVSSLIYHWTGTYMDVTAEISTTGAVSVTTFNHKQSTIIVFAQNVKGRPRIGSEVFKFRNGLVEKIQFLPTDGPISVHRYDYDRKTFLLVINEFSASKVFWWDGKEFLNWIELPDINSPTKVDIVYVDGETLLLVSQQSTFSMYKIMNLNYIKLDLLEMKDGYLIADFSARVKGKSIILVLVTKSDRKPYRIEPFEMVITEFPGESIDEPDGALQYLTRLDQRLKSRMPGINEAYESWPALLSSEENLILSSQLKVDELIIESGSISEILVKSRAEVLTPTELESGLEQLDLIANTLLTQSNGLLLLNETAEIEGIVQVDGDAFFDEMHIDSLTVEKLNDAKVELEDTFSYTKDQEFYQPLRGSSVTIENLEIDSICGIPFENWLRKENSSQTPLDLLGDNVSIFKDTILVEGDLHLGNIGTSMLNNMDLKLFFNDLFIIGSNQIIKGNIFYKLGLNANDLWINSTNDMGADQLLTKKTNQKLLGNFFIKTLEVEDLFVSTINGVSVNEAARISQENVILGQITFRRLIITEEFDVHDDVSVRFDVRPMQMYGDVELNGDLTLRDLLLPSGSSLYLNGRQVDIDQLFANHWTKSTDQMIPKSVKLEGGITIDDLRSEYLNGYRDEDFLYTIAEEIPDKFGRLHFQRLEIDGMLNVEAVESPAESIFASGNDDDTLIVGQKILIKNLTVGNLNAKSYNKIPIEYITSGKIGATIPGTVRYESLVVTNEFNTENALVKFLNGKDLSRFFQEVLYLDRSYQIDYFEVEKLIVEDFGLEFMNGLDMAEFHRMLIYKDVTAIRNITVDGDLEVTGELAVEFVNGFTSADFVNKLATEDVVMDGEQSTLESFTVLGNLSVNLLKGIKIEEVASNTLSRTKSQTIRGQFTFGKVQANYIWTHEINSVNVTNLKLVSDPLIIQDHLTFSNLIVKGDVITGYLNGLDIDETYDKALLIPFTEIGSLIINGRTSWESLSEGFSSFSDLMKNALTKNTDQTISAEVVFADNVEAFGLTRPGGVIEGVNISSVVLDTVFYNQSSGDEETAQIIEGEKYFSKGLIVHDFTVTGDIGFHIINDRDILLINSTTVRNFDEQIVTGATTFREDITVEELEVQGKVHGLDPRHIATSDSKLPKNTRFAHIEVQDDLKTEKLDGIDFDEFLRNRVTLNGNHIVYEDVVFDDQVAVTQNAAVTIINGINVSDFVLNDVEDVQLISSEKIFHNDFSVHGNVVVESINDVRVTEEHQNGIFNNEYNININGDIIFSADFQTQSNVSVNGLINGIKLSDLLYGDVSAEAKKIINTLENDQNSIDSAIEISLNATRSLPDVFFYLDVEQELVIRAPKIRKVEKVFATDSTTRLNLYGFESGRACGLPDVCLCPTQYVAELLDNDECKIWRVPGSRTIYNFHDPESRFGVNVVSKTVSTSQLCLRENHEKEVTKISWIIPGEILTGDLAGKIPDNTLKINGYLSDAKTFTIGAEIYVVLGIYYDAALNSHNVDSLVYRIDLRTGNIELAQRIQTSGAVALEIFSTRLSGTHLLIACASSSAESQLHRFNAGKSKFELLRTFWTGGSLNVKSLIQGEESFVLIDDPRANTVHIFKYDIKFDNYNFYQSIFHNSLVKNIEVFYSGGISASDAYVIVTTEEGRFFVYEYMFFGGFQLRFEQWLDGVQTMAPFYYSGRRYIFAGTLTNSTVYRIVQQGPMSNW